MTRFRPIVTVILAAISLTAMIGCGSDKPPAPLSQFQPEIVNNPDAFSFQATDVQNVSTTLTYVWANSGTQASVDHSSVVTAGSASVTLYDANDSLVYTQGLLASANEQSNVGVAGNWRLVVQLTNVNGTLNFRAQKF